MRLIDADELIVIEYGGIKFVPKEFIDEAPTVDAVPVVRCAAWYTKTTTAHAGRGRYSMRLIDADALAEAIKDEIVEAKCIDADPNFVAGLRLGFAYINTAPTVIEVVDECPSDWDGPEDEIYNESEEEDDETD